MTSEPYHSKVRHNAANVCYAWIRDRYVRLFCRWLDVLVFEPLFQGLGGILTSLMTWWFHNF